MSTDNLLRSTRNPNIDLILEGTHGCHSVSDSFRRVLRSGSVAAPRISTSDRKLVEQTMAKMFESASVADIVHDIDNGEGTLQAIRESYSETFEKEPYQNFDAAIEYASRMAFQVYESVRTGKVTENNKEAGKEYFEKGRKELLSALKRGRLLHAIEVLKKETSTGPIQVTDSKVDTEWVILIGIPDSDVYQKALKASEELRKVGKDPKKLMPELAVVDILSTASAAFPAISPYAVKALANAVKAIKNEL